MKWWEWCLGILFAIFAYWLFTGLSDYHQEREKECAAKGGYLSRYDGCVTGRRLQ